MSDKVPLAKVVKPCFHGLCEAAKWTPALLASGFGVWSDGPELIDPCVRTGLTLGCVRSDSTPVIGSLSDPLTPCNGHCCLLQHQLMCRCVLMKKDNSGLIYIYKEKWTMYPLPIFQFIMIY